MTTGSFYSVDGSHALIAETTAGTWQIGLPVSRKDADIQVRASWSQAAAGGALTPLAIVARRIDNANAYRVEIRENPGGQLDLRIVKLVAGTSTVLQTATAIGTYSLHGAGTADDDWWYVRFQLEGTSLRALAITTTTVTITATARSAARRVRAAHSRRAGALTPGGNSCREARPMSPRGQAEGPWITEPCG